MRISQLLSVLLFVSVAHTSAMLRQMGAVGARSRVVTAIPRARYASNNKMKELEQKINIREEVEAKLRKSESKLRIKEIPYKELVGPYLIGRLYPDDISPKNARKLLNLTKEIEQCKQDGILTWQVSESYKLAMEIRDSYWGPGGHCLLGLCFLFTEVPLVPLPFLYAIYAQIRYNKFNKIMEQGGDPETRKVLQYIVDKDKLKSLSKHKEEK